MTDEAERIADGLPEDEVAVMRDGFRDEAAAERLARKGLCWKISAHFDFDPVRYCSGGWKLRPLGLRVRRILKDRA